MKSILGVSSAASSVYGTLMYMCMYIFDSGMNYWRRLEGRACPLLSGTDQLSCPGWR